MCKVYNTIGCLTAIKLQLDAHGINEYQSLNALINFQKDYPSTRQQIISKHRFLIEGERNLLSVELDNLDDSIKARKAEVEQQLTLYLRNLDHQLNNLSAPQANIIQALIGSIKKISLKLKIWFNKVILNFRIARAVRHLVQDHNKKIIRYQFIVSNTESAVMQSCALELHELDRKKRVIDEINSFIYGAFGEQMVVRELEKLPDNCFVINDFSCQFHPAIYSKKENEYIKSVQIDHILITPSGIFLIETKNWSQSSVNDPNLYSPVQQIKRASFALYRILNEEFYQRKWSFKKHPWGNRKIPTRNLIVFTNHKPVGEFQYVKILTLNDLLGYIRYFEPCFSNEETRMIADQLLTVCGING
jgi:hypothetical protein